MTAMSRNTEKRTARYPREGSNWKGDEWIKNQSWEDRMYGFHQEEYVNDTHYKSDILISSK